MENRIIMRDTVLTIENLGKRYIITHQDGYMKKPGYSTLREVVHGRASMYMRKMWKTLRFSSERAEGVKNPISPKREEFWALRNVSFSVKRGEKIGIIGRNGAGKTTILKLLSRITEPTTGRIHFRGRVATLLEVGTGFHPELTGRENIYLNGVILGMTRREVREKFDEIVAFAEVEKFLDTPVKRYSSGMYVRLAFSVAAHLDAEILLIDEVLAVGDTAFQKKCLGKMEDVSAQGRTILFVSHQMGQISTLCPRSIFIKEGHIVYDGETEKTIEHYIDSLRDLHATNLRDRKDRLGSGALQIVDTWIENENGKRTDHVFSGEEMKLIVAYENKGLRENTPIFIVILINNVFGVDVTHLTNRYTEDCLTADPVSGVFVCTIPRLSLNSGFFTYSIAILSSDVNGDVIDYIQSVKSFTVEPGDFFRSGKVPLDTGIMTIDHSWFGDEWS